jgi:hypothetical protein
VRTGKIFETARNETMHLSSNVIDDLSRNPPLATIGTRWQVVTDQVMGGISSGTMVREIVAGRSAIHMRGSVRLENNGGFVQIALDLAPDGKTVDARAWIGIELDVLGNGEEYNLHLRTRDLTRPWQSYRHSFKAVTRWQTVRLPFSSFSPHRTEAPLDLRRLQRVGLVAIGRVFSADLALSGIGFFA